LQAVPKTTAELFAERTQRLLDAYAMKVPDRVPISLNLGYMLAKFGGITCEELDSDFERAQQLLEQAAVYLQPDQVMGLGPFVSKPSRMLGDRQTKWAGYGLSPNSPMQFVEDEYMKSTDYDEFLDDPTNFTLRKFLPRVYRELEGLALLPRIPVLITGYPSYATLVTLTNPSLRSALETLAKVADFFVERGHAMRRYAERMAVLGFPSGLGRAGSFSMAPFDFIGDTMRGMRGVMLDMYRRPEKLLAAEEKARRICAESAIEICRATGSKFVFIPLHRGSDGFMSVEQFETFYWPQLKGLLMDLIEADVMPTVFYEGVWDERLRYLRELPKGKTAGHFQATNPHKIKETVGDIMPISGCFPVALVQMGTREAIRDHTKKLCEVLGKNGGFIMAANSSMDECNPELVKVWVDATKEFGVY